MLLAAAHAFEYAADAMNANYSLILRADEATMLSDAINIILPIDDYPQPVTSFDINPHERDDNQLACDGDRSAQDGATRSASSGPRSNSSFREGCELRLSGFRLTHAVAFPCIL